MAEQCVSELSVCLKKDLEGMFKAFVADTRGDLVSRSLPSASCAYLRSGVAQRSVPQEFRHLPR